jgi:hypothetical protein
MYHLIYLFTWCLNLFLQSSSSTNNIFDDLPALSAPSKSDLCDELVPSRSLSQHWPRACYWFSRLVVRETLCLSSPTSHDTGFRAVHGPAWPEIPSFGLAWGCFGFSKPQARPKLPLTAWLGPGRGFYVYKYFVFIQDYRLVGIQKNYAEQYISSSSSSIKSPSQENSLKPESDSSSPGSPTPESFPVLAFSSSWSSDSSLSFASNIDDGAGSLKSKSCQIAHLIHCRASTMSPLRQLRHFDIVSPPCENARSLDTDDDIIAR